MFKSQNVVETSAIYLQWTRCTKLTKQLAVDICTFILCDVNIHLLISYESNKYERTLPKQCGNADKVYIKEETRRRTG